MSATMFVVFIERILQYKEEKEADSGGNLASFVSIVDIFAGLDIGKETNHGRNADKWL